MLQTQIIADFGKMWAKQALPLLTNGTAYNETLKVPQAVSPAIGFSSYNLRQFGPSVALPTVTVALICKSGNARFLKHHQY